MPLNFDLEKIENYKEVCWMEDEVKGDEGETLYKIVPKTEVLTFFTMTCGIPKITKSNWKEFYLRVSMWEKAMGCFCYMIVRENEEDEGRKVEDFFTMEDIYKHIGLATNAATKTKTQFLKALWDTYERVEGYRLNKFSPNKEEVCDA